MQDNNNPQLSYYLTHGISPVHQDISDLKLHLARREKLYRKLGITPIAFNNKKLLEIGPGGGFNSLAFFSWGANIDFVEANPTACDEIKKLMADYGIGEDRWRLFPCQIEDLNLKGETGLYDIVIIEGVLQGMLNYRDIIAKISGLTRPGGVVVVTCEDEVSFFFENIKRIVASKLIRHEENFDQKVKILSNAFRSHLKTLKHSVKPAEDWVMDNLLNPAFYSQPWGIPDLMNAFDEKFEFLGSSPTMFTDYSWHKNVETEYRKEILKQFTDKHHMLIYWDLKGCFLDTNENKLLLDICIRVDRLFKAIIKEYDYELERQVLQALDQAAAILGKLDGRLSDIINEAKTLLTEPCITAEKVAEANYFATAFGRNQYLSMTRKYCDINEKM